MKRHWIWAVCLYALLLGGGFWLGQSLPYWFAVSPQDTSILAPMVILVALVYTVASALPFIPGAEIGFALIMVFGVRIALMVYLCMVLALWLAFAIGQLVPKKTLLAIFYALRLKRAAVLVRQTAEMTPAERSAHLLDRVPGRVAPFLLRNRFLALIVMLNIPGNAVVGGGGGLALVAGMSRLFNPLGFAVATALAVAPVPVLLMLWGYQP